MNQMMITSILMVVVIVLLIRGKTPLSFVGLLIAFVSLFFGLLEPRDVFSQFANSSMFLISEVFVISGAMIQVGVADIIGEGVKKAVGDSNSEVKVIILIVSVTTLMCAFLPRIAVAATLIPIVVSIAKSTKISRTKLLFMMAATCSIGGSITLIATPPNLLAKSMLEEAGLGSIGFFDFAPVGIPMAIIGGILMVLLRNSSFIPSRIDENEFDDDFDAEVSEKNYKKSHQILSLSVFLVLVLSIMFEKKTGVASYVVGLFGILVLIITGVIDEKTAFNKSINWSMMFFIAGMLTLGSAMDKSGVGNLLADFVVNLLGENPEPLIILITFFILSAGLTQFMNNTAAAGMLLPLGLRIAAGLGIDPKSVIMAITIGCNASFMTPMATPANAMVMVPGDIKFMDFVKLGIPMMIITFVLVITIFPFVYPFY
jgi:sodium-dependent dicarboxylate transporter 2/3/5